MKRFIRLLYSVEDGQGALEYGLIIAVVTIGMIAGLMTLSGEIEGSLEWIGEFARDETEEAAP